MDKIKRHNAVESRMIQASGGITQWCSDSDVTVLESEIEWLRAENEGMVITGRALYKVGEKLRNDKANLNKALIDMSELVQSVSEENVSLKSENEALMYAYNYLATDQKEEIKRRYGFTKENN